MKELKLSLEKTVAQDERKIEIYSIGNYTVRVSTWSDSSAQYTTVDTARGEYVPEIYCRGDFEGKVLGFEIQTSSYGSVSVEEVQKMIAGLEEAVEVAKILEKEFVK